MYINPLPFPTSMDNLFSATLFFVVLREALEVSIIVSVLLAFITRLQLTDLVLLKNLRKRVWLGTGIASALVIGVGVAFVVIWYKYGTNLFEASELLYEAIFGLIAAIFVTLTGFAFLNGRHLYQKMTQKLESKLTVENATSVNVLLDAKEESPMKTSLNMQLFFWVPFLTVIREGMETVLMIGGVSFAEPASSIPLAAACGLLAGGLIGYIIHRAAGKLSLKWFFNVASFILFLLAAGIFSRSVGTFEDYKWSQETQIEPDEMEGMFDPRTVVWHLECCSEKSSPGFALLYSLVGYRSVATIGTVVSYIAYWVFVILAIVIMKRRGQN